VNILRLSIHRHLWKARNGKVVHDTLNHNDFQHTVQLCRDLAGETIEAITPFVTLGDGMRAFGTFATISLIECIYTLVALPPLHSVMDDSGYCGIATALVQKATQCVKMTAQSQVKLAQSAFNVLKRFLQRGICVRHRAHE